MWATSDQLLVDVVKENLKQNPRQCIFDAKSRFEFNVDFLSQLHCNVYKILNETNLMEITEDDLLKNLIELQKNFFILNENVEEIVESNEHRTKKDLIFSQIYKLNEATKICLKQLERTLPKQFEHLRRAAKERSTQMKQEIWSLLIHMKQNLNTQKVEALSQLSLLNTLTTTENLYSNLLHNLKKVLDLDFDFTTDFGALNELPFLKLDAAFYGIQSFILAAFSICQICDQLAENFFQHGCLEKCNDFIIENFNAFKANLIDEGNCVDFNERIFADDADFYLVERLGKLLQRTLEIEAIKQQRSLVELLQNRLESLRQIDEFLKNASLPVIPAQPKIVVSSLSFEETLIETPFGEWQQGARVSYAIQFKTKQKISKIGPWSEAYTVNDKACPILKVPLDEMGRIRLIYRKFDDARPQLVGVLENPHETSFYDINRELFELAYDANIKDMPTKFSQLLQNGADLDAAYENGRTVLHAAAAAANVHLMEFLLQNGNFDIDIDINLKDFNGYTPLHIAAAEGHLNFVALLLKLNAIINAQTARLSLTALHLATAKGHVAIVVALLKESDVDINSKDKDGFTALHYAVLQKQTSLIDILLTNGKIDINCKSVAGLTPLHLAVITQNIDAIGILLKNPHIDVNLQNNATFSALHFAVFTRNLQVLKLLLSFPSINVNLKALNNFTALHYVVLLRDEYLLNELLNFESCCVNAMAVGEFTALHMAVVFDEKNILMLLLKAGAEIDARTKLVGYTALHIAVKFGRETLLQPLIEHGANLGLKTFDGLTCLELATYNESSHLACFRWLIESGALTS